MANTGNKYFVLALEAVASGTLTVEQANNGRLEYFQRQALIEYLITKESQKDTQPEPGSIPISGTFDTKSATSTGSALVTDLEEDTVIVQIQPEQDVRVKVDGNSAAPNDGFLILANTLVNLSVEEALAMSIAREGGSDVTVNIQEFK